MHIWNKINPNISQINQSTPVFIIQSLEGKSRIFSPGRTCTPCQVSMYHEKIVSYALKTLIENNFDINPQKTIGISILTEGAGVPFFRAFNHVWPNQKVGGRLNVWAKRKLDTEETSELLYTAKMNGVDTAPEESPIENAVGIIFDIGATGATLRETVKNLPNYFEKLVFSSPCMSLQSAQVFVTGAIEAGYKPENLAVVANEGFFGLHENGTFLTFQIPGYITSTGNEKLSKFIYPHKNFCHIGAGGLAANWQYLYEEELVEDEEKFGELNKFENIEAALKAANLNWPEDFSKLSC